MGLAIPVIEGGDHFSQFRFYQPLWPLLPLPAFAAARWLADHVDMSDLQLRLSRLRVPVLLVMGLSIVAASTTKWFRLRDLPFAGEIHIAQRGRVTGERLNALFTDVPDVGVLMAGGIRYGYDGAVIDLLGLNHAQMAHAPGDRRGIKGHAAFNRHVFEQLSSAILLPRASTQIPETNPFLDSWYDVPLQGLLQDDAFLQRYAVAHVSRTNEPSTGVYRWFRQDVLRPLAQSGLWDVTFLE